MGILLQLESCQIKIIHDFIVETFFNSQFWNKNEFDIALACVTCLKVKGTLQSEDVLQALEAF